MSGATGPWRALVGPRPVAPTCPGRGGFRPCSPSTQGDADREATGSVSGARVLPTAGRPAQPDGLCPHGPLPPQCTGLSGGDGSLLWGHRRGRCVGTQGHLSLDCSQSSLPEVLRAHHLNDSDKGYDRISILSVIIYSFKKSHSDRCPRGFEGLLPNHRVFGQT